MRNAFADEVTRIAKADPRVVLLSGDIGNRLFDTFRVQSPNQFLNCGVAEQNMMSVAAGLGLSGLLPVVYTITPFATVRCLEQIKVDVAYHESPVTIVGTGSGLSYASLGPTHHSLEDFAIFRAIPNLQILAPWDAPSLRACLRMAFESGKPTYIRIGKKGEVDLCENQAVPRIGFGLTLRTGERLCILAVGTVAHEARAASILLETQGIEVEVVLTHTVKPFPSVLIENLLSRFECFVTLEEHARIGGFGEAFLSHLALQGSHKRVVCLGTGDMFMPIVGSLAFARSHFGIDAAAIVRAARYLLEE